MEMYPELITWSRLKISSTSITTLDLILLTSEHASLTGDMISAVAANLQRLRLRLSPHWLRSSRRSNSLLVVITISPTTYLDFVVECVYLLGLPYCSSLQKFSLYFSPALLPTPPEEYSCESWEFLEESLNELPPTVRRISIGFVDDFKTADEDDQAELLERNSRLEWTEIDEKLSAMRQLEKVKFTLERELVYNFGRCAMSSLNISLIQAKLPQTMQRGVLRCLGVDGLV